MLKKILRLRSGISLTQFEFFTRMVAWLDRHFTGAGHEANIQRILSKMFHIKDTRGNSEAIKYVKQTRQGLLKVLESLPFESIGSKNMKNIKFPRYLGFLQRVEKDKFYPCIRLVLSTLAIFRFLKGDGKPSFSTIQQGSSKTGIPTDVAEKSIPFLSSLGLNPKYFGKRSSKLNFKKYKMTVKSGPKGHALWTSYLDLLYMPDCLKTAIGYVGGSRLQEDMENYLAFIPYIRELLDTHLGKTRMSLRRLSVIRDKEGKNREIAIMDYYSQQALQPLHEYLFRVLRRIPQDCTFDQGQLIESLQPTKGSSFHSLDLSSATDRFPIEVQAHLLETLFGKEYSQHWQTIMVGYPFDYQGQSISYARGNPMGAYSSWTAFVLAHHFFVYLACEKAGIRWRDCPYMLLGDDIVIADDKVASNYMELLQRFDIPFSLEKSHQSPYLFEFAKRFVHCGTEISPFPLAALYENRNNWLLAIGTIIEETFRKRWNLRIDIYRSCTDYLKALGLNAEFIQKREAQLLMVISLREAFAGKRDMAEVIILSAYLRNGRKFADEIRSIEPTYLVNKVLLGAFLTIYKSSLEKLTDGSDKKPLGVIAEQISFMATASFGIVDDPFMLIRSCPILNVYGEVVETLLKLQHDHINMDASRALDYKNIFRTVSTPTSDESFYMRRKDVLQINTSRLADEILSTMEEAREYPQVLYPYG